MQEEEGPMTRPSARLALLLLILVPGCDRTPPKNTLMAATCAVRNATSRMRVQAGRLFFHRAGAVSQGLMEPPMFFRALRSICG